MDFNLVCLKCFLGSFMQMKNICHACEEKFASKKQSVADYFQTHFCFPDHHRLHVLNNGDIFWKITFSCVQAH